MINKKLVQDLQSQLTEKLIVYMKTKELSIVEFKTPFRIYIQEEKFDGDCLRVPLAACYLYQDGRIGTHDGYIILKELDIYELAHIADVLEEGAYSVADEEITQ